jgi:hypothetical protein
VTTVTGSDTALVLRCRGAARQDGLAPALTVIAEEVLPGLLPCGPGGHALVAAPTYRDAEGVWADGATRPRDTGRENLLGTYDLPGGSVVTAAVAAGAVTAGGFPSAATAEGLAARLVPSTAAGGHRQDLPDLFALALVWLRLGLSEALRAQCVSHLGRRRSGDTYLLQQQMVKGTVAETVTEQLEIRAVLADARAGDLPRTMLRHLNTRITAADREQVRLLGASGYLTDGPGMTAYVSELLAEVYPAVEETP